MSTAYDPVRDGKNWQKYGACTAVDLAVFEPPANEYSTDPATLAQITQAKAVCCRCLVIERCLRDALDRRDVTGVRGGLSGPEREALLRRQVSPGRHTAARKNTVTREKQPSPTPKPKPAPTAATAQAALQAELQERRAKWAAKQRAYRAQRWAAMTPEEQAAYRAEKAEANRLYRDRQRKARQLAERSEGAA